MKQYNPANRYWAIAGNTTEVWSSAAAAFVSVTDASCEAWLSSGGIPTNILSASELYDVLAAQYPPGIGPTLGPLTPQQNYDSAIEAGCQIVSTSTPAISGTYPLDDSTLLKMVGEQNYIQLKSAFTNGATTRGWLDVSGGIHVFPNTGAFTAFGEAVAAYMDALQTALTTALQGGSWVAPGQPVTIP